MQELQLKLGQKFSCYTSKSSLFHCCESTISLIFSMIFTMFSTILICIPFDHHLLHFSAPLDFHLYSPLHPFASRTNWFPSALSHSHLTIIHSRPEIFGVYKMRCDFVSKNFATPMDLFSCIAGSHQNCWNVVRMLFWKFSLSS